MRGRVQSQVQRLHIIDLVDQVEGKAVGLTLRQIGLVFLQKGFQAAVIAQTPLHHVGIPPDGVKIAFQISAAENQAEKPELATIKRRELFQAVKGDIAALYDQILLIFDGRFDHFLHYGPEKGRQLGVGALGGQGTETTADQPHLQMVDREEGPVEPLQEPLGQKGLAGVTAAGKEDYHGTRPFL